MYRPNQASRMVLSAIQTRMEETKVAHADDLQRASELEALLASLQAEHNSITNQIAPISSLPNELLNAIFNFLFVSTSWTKPAIEVVLSHVNRRFRDCATSIRSFWTRIRVSLCTPFDMVITYLQRSGTSPFDLCFCFNIDVDDMDRSAGSIPYSYVLLYSTTEWNTIMSCMTRCRRLFIQCNKPNITADLISRLSAVEVPLLQSFRIKYDGGCYESYSGSHYRIFMVSDAPSLMSVRIEGWSLCNCLPPLSSVTSLTLMRPTQWMTWTDFREMISGHPAMTRLVVGDIFDNYFLPDNFESTVLLPSLKFLRICADHDGPLADQVLLAISAPALEFLVLNIDGFTDISRPFRIANRVPYLRYCGVSVLPGGKAVSRESWTSFCSSFPGITNFALLTDSDRTGSSDHLITALNYSSANSVSSAAPHLFPELHTLSFGHISVHTATTLRDLVSNRQRLSSLHLPADILNDEAFASTLDRLLECVEVEEYQAHIWEGDDDNI